MTVSCKGNPYVDHGFDRNGSHNEGKYICRCREVYEQSSWEKGWEKFNRIIFGNKSGK